MDVRCWCSSVSVVIRHNERETWWQRWDKRTPRQEERKQEKYFRNTDADK